MSFINEYNYYLETEKNFQMSTLNKAIQRLRKVVKFALGHDYLDKDPFLLYTAKSVKKELVYLTQEELMKLENQHLLTLLQEKHVPRLEINRELRRENSGSV